MLKYSATKISKKKKLVGAGKTEKEV